MTSILLLSLVSIVDKFIHIHAVSEHHNTFVDFLKTFLRVASFDNCNFSLDVLPLLFYWVLFPHEQVLS
jgi:hypothetical protein